MTDEPGVALLASIERRYLILLALRWLPVGFVAPLLVLILTTNLPLAQAGVLLAIYGATVVLLELPTGGLADALGRRPVLLASSSAAVLAFVLLTLNAGFVVLSVAMVALGVSRALDSGPLESWFVDESQQIDPRIDLRVGLSRGGVVDGLALAAGAIAGGFLPQLFDGRLRVAVIASLVVQVVHLVAVPVLMVERRPARSSSVRSAVADTPLIMRRAARLARSEQAIGKLLLSGVTIGVAFAAVELLWQPRFFELAGDGTGILGVVLALAFAGGAVGAALAPKAGGSGPFAVQLIGAVALVGLAAAGSLVLAAVAFIVFYAANGAAGPLRDELLHHEVPAESRTTMLSADSVAFQIGGFLSSIGLAALAQRTSVSTAWAVGAIVLGVGAALYRGIDRRPERSRTIVG